MTSRFTAAGAGVFVTDGGFSLTADEYSRRIMTKYCGNCEDILLAQTPPPRELNEDK